ncbi:MAG: methyltransferase [Chloroflexi bacterium]|nr:methyltransferase [Chloroflexota bacterium]
MTVADRQAFVLQHTRLQSPPLVPELYLHLADEVTPIWQLVEADRGDADVPLPFWATAWAGGQAIARYLLDHPKEVSGRRVLDLATGSGLCAIAAVKAGAVDVLAVDVDPISEAAVALNADANDVIVPFLRRDLLDAKPPSTDLILAGDVCYEKQLAERVLTWLRSAKARGARVLLGDPNRNYLPREGLVRLADYHVPTTREVEGMDSKVAAVFTFPD